MGQFQIFRVHALAGDRHRSREFIEFLELVNAAYPPETAIRVILGNHSAHVSNETNAWLAKQPEGRFAFTFTPKHGSWLDLIEGFLSKLASSVRRHIRAASKQEPKERLMAAIDGTTNFPYSILGLTNSMPLDMIRTWETPY